MIDTYKTEKNSIWHVKGRGYNKNCVLYPRPFTCQKEFLLFYMCQSWALHVVIKRVFLHLSLLTTATKIFVQVGKKNMRFSTNTVYLNRR